MSENKMLDVIIDVEKLDSETLEELSNGKEENEDE